MTGSDIYDRQWQDILDIFECSWGWLITYYLILSNTICWTLLPPNYYYAILHKYVNKRSELAPTDSPAKKGYSDHLALLMPKPPNSQNGKGPKRAANSKEPRHGNMSGAISINTYPFYILHFTFYIFLPPAPPLSLMPHSLGSPWLEAHQRQPLPFPPVRYCFTP